MASSPVSDTMKQRTQASPRMFTCTKTLAMMVAMLALTGCANKAPPPLYGWNGYEKNLDTYFRGDRESLDTQAKQMEDNLRKIRSAGQATPPGYQAHLGLLHGKQGDLARFQQQLQAEKEQFPESETFVNFLLRQFKPK